MAGRARQRRGAKDALAGAHQLIDREARRALPDQAAASSLFSQAEPNCAGRGAAFGSGSLQGRGAFLADRGYQHLAVTAGDDVAGGFDITKRAWRRRRSGRSRRPRRSGRSRRTRWPCSTRLAFGAGRAGSSRLPAHALRTRGPLLSCFALRPGRPGRPPWPLAAGGPGQTRHALGAARTGRSLRALETAGQQDRGG